MIIAEGQIVSGKSGRGLIGSTSFVSQLNSAVDDDQVKAIVLRINSPGGSALASDVMWRAIQIAREKKTVLGDD